MRIRFFADLLPCSFASVCFHLFKSVFWQIHISILLYIIIDLQLQKNI